MQLVERHIITEYNKNWKEIDTICYLSKNLYNSTIWRIKKHLEETGKFLSWEIKIPGYYLIEYRPCILLYEHAYEFSKDT